MWLVRRLIEYAIFCPPRPTYTREFVSITGRSLIFLGNGGDDTPILEYITDPNAPWILYSHGMRCDLGKLDRHIDKLSRDLCVNILLYEFPGYGCSRPSGCCSGSSTEQSCYNSITRAYDYLVQQGVKRIILYGVSLGTGPVIELATRVSVDGVVLRSPFLSLGIFHNLGKMHRITAPVLCIHGTRDWLVPWFHTEALCRRTSNYKLLYLPGGHGDLMRNYEMEIVQGLREFLKTCIHNPGEEWRTSILTKSMPIEKCE